MASLALIGSVLAAAGCDPRTDLTDVVPTLALSSTAVNPTGTLAGAPVTETVTIINGTDGALENLSASIQYPGATSGWLSATFDRTTATRDQAATLQLRASPGTLGLGIYPANVVVAATGAGNGPLTIAVRFTVDPRPPAKILIVTQPPSQATNGEALSGQPVVQLLNAIDEVTPKAGVVITASVAAGGPTGQLTGSVAATTDANGRAAFVDLGILGLVGDRSLVFSAPNIASSTSTTITLIAGPPARLETASATTQTADAGSAVAEAPRAKVVDQSGNGIAGFDVSFAASAGSAITPGGTIVTTIAGTAGPSSWILSQAAGGNTVTASATGLAGSPVSFSATGRAGPPAQLVKQSGDNLIGLVGKTLATPHLVKVGDQFGNGVAGVAVAWTAGGGGTTSPASGVTDADGVTGSTRSLPAAPGQITTTATATIGGALLAAVFTVTAATTAPAQIVKVAGDNQVGLVATALAVPIRVLVLDPSGAPQPNITVTFTTANLGGTFPGGAAVLTDAAGFASASWRLGSQSGIQTAQAATGGPSPATFTATATPGPLDLAQSTVALTPATITAGGAAATITVTAKDGFGNPIAGLAVTLSNTGGGTLTQPTGPTDGSGQATGTYRSTVTGPKVVSATIGGQSLGQAATITVAAGPPAQIQALTATAFTVRFGQVVTPLPSVRLLDAFGNPVPGAAVTFGVTSGQSSVSPTTTATNAAGIATASSWIIAPLGSGSDDNVYNRLSVAAGGAGIANNPVGFLGTATVSFASDVYQYLQTCAGLGCHSTQTPVVVDPPNQAYTLLLEPSQRYVIPGDSITGSGVTNLLYRKPGGVEPHTGGVRPSNLITAIKAWIRQGAPNN